MKKIVLLGATGSIGTSTLRVIEAHPDLFQLIAISAATQADKALAIAQRYHVPHVAITDNSAYQSACATYPSDITLHGGQSSLSTLASLPEADIVLCAVVGMAGLLPTLAAIHAKHDVALATKEVLVAAGDLVMAERARYGVKLLPVDSEHSALYQCLQSRSFVPACTRTSSTDTPAESAIETLILTASGGPFYNTPDFSWSQVTLASALNHPRWKMGAKVTIDSATMMNKGLELIEACHLYNIPQDKVQIWVHPQSIIHSLVHFVDGSYLAQLAPPDMAIPIQFALSAPDRLPTPMPTLDLSMMRQLDFDAPDTERFPCLALARRAIQVGQSLPAVMNGANEVAVQAFLDGRITADRIAPLITAAMDNLPLFACHTVDDYLHADHLARQLTLATISALES